MGLLELANLLYVVHKVSTIYILHNEIKTILEGQQQYYCKILNMLDFSEPGKTYTAYSCHFSVDISLIISSLESIQFNDVSN